MDEKRTVAEISIGAQEVLRRLGKCQVGDIVSYEELSKLALGNVQKDKRHCLVTAMNRLLNDDGMVFECVRNEGVVRIDDKRIVNTSGVGLKRIRQMSRKNMKRLSVVSYDGLPDDAKVKHNTAMTLYKMATHVTEKNTEKAVESKTSEAHAAMSVGDVFRLFVK